jgi:hypothetical protein
MAQIEFQLSGDDRAACVPLWKTENGNPVAKAFALHIDADIANRRADTALARRGDSSSRRRSGKPFRGMDSAGKIPQGRAPWPSIALAWRSRSLKRPAGSSRTMHRHRHRCWSRTFRPARIREERSFALVASLGKRSSPLPHQYIPSGIGCVNSPVADEFNYKGTSNNSWFWRFCLSWVTREAAMAAFAKSWRRE